MKIEGLDYNTQRSKLQIPEYGREIQKMVEYAITIKDRKERQQCAESIVSTMQRIHPQTGDVSTDLHKFWDHLALMSDFKLDVDYPFDVDIKQGILSKPAPMKYSKNNIRVRHYGVLLEKTFEKLKTMPEGEERDRLVELTANQMKSCLINYSHGSVDSQKVADDLAFFTDGKIKLDLNTFRFANITPNRAPANKRRRNR
jgi:hypothetical protein